MSQRRSSPPGGRQDSKQLWTATDQAAPGSQTPPEPAWPPCPDARSTPTGKEEIFWDCLQTVCRLTLRTYFILFSCSTSARVLSGGSVYVYIPGSLGSLPIRGSLEALCYVLFYSLPSNKTRELTFLFLISFFNGWAFYPTQRNSPKQLLPPI